MYEKLLKLFLLVSVLFFLLINNFSCLIYENDFSECFYSGFGFPRNEFIFYIEVVFAICLISIGIKNLNSNLFFVLYLLSSIILIFYFIEIFSIRNSSVIIVSYIAFFLTWIIFLHWKLIHNK